MDNFGVLTGKSFADLNTIFIAKPLELGKHTVVFKEFDPKKAYIPTNAKQEVVPAVVVVDGETHTRIQNFTMQGTEILGKNAGRQFPELANQNLGGILTALVKEALVLEMWIVQKPSEDGKMYYNWQFYEPVVVKDSQQNDAVANSLT